MKLIIEFRDCEKEHKDIVEEIFMSLIEWKYFCYNDVKFTFEVDK